MTFEGIDQFDSRVAYRALRSRDPRFDGVFFVGVTSTGIYCRPICPAKTPRRNNCRFFPTAERAEKARFRPCLRCRPELAPGNAPVDRGQRLAQLVVQRIQEGLADEGTDFEEVAAQFGISSRHLRRVLQNELGVSPIELRQTRRLLLAKQLLTETKLPVTEIAFASGFSSLRRFNAAFVSQYRLAPTRLRRALDPDAAGVRGSATSTLRLSYRPPYHWSALLDFLRARVIKEVEIVSGESYARTVQIGQHRGWIKVTQATEENGLLVEFTHLLMPVLPALLGRLRNLFDLSARPDVIAGQLRKASRFKKSLRTHPGLRVPGAFDAFELAVRAVLGQQISVKAATTVSGRFAEAFGEKIETPFPELLRLTPTAERVARAAVEEIACLGITGARARCILALAEGFATKTLRLEPGADPETSMQKLVSLPGIGEWTAHYIAMRALRWPDAFLKEDIAIRNRLGGVSAKEAEAISQVWRPWRSYAVMHLWSSG